MCDEKTEHTLVDVGHDEMIRLAINTKKII